MDIISNYNSIKIKMESQFQGLPYTHIILIKSLISLADLKTGIVNNISDKYLCSLLAVNSASFRKKIDAPNKKNIRNYIKSIERKYGKHFKIISEGKNFQFLFPSMPSLFKEMIEAIEFKTGLLYGEFVENTEPVNDECSSYAFKADTEVKNYSTVKSNNTYVINRLILRSS